jgi:hypothetical protein
MTSTVIQLAIGLIFVFFLVGSAASFLNELVAAVLDRRAKHLQRWCNAVLGADAVEFFSHPLIKKLRRARRVYRATQTVATTDRQSTSQSDSATSMRDPATTTGQPAAKSEPATTASQPKSYVPSYISPTTFATIILSLLGHTDTALEDDRIGVAGPAPARSAQGTEGRGGPAHDPDLSGLLTDERLLVGIRELKNDEFQRLLLTLLADAGGTIEGFRRRLEDWFTEQMDRLSGFYKRKTKWFLILWGLGFAVCLNVDSVLITRALWTDSTLRSAVVAEAQQAVAPPSTKVGGGGTPPPCSIAPPAGKSASSTTSTTDPLDCVAARVETLRSLQLPIGWPGPPWESTVHGGTDRRMPRGGASWWLKALGLIITGLAAGQGGPFWFELLGKVINLRATGPPPGKPTGNDRNP